MLRYERKHWKIEDIILESITCVILHNVIVGMQKKGELEEQRDISGHRLTGQEVVSELFVEEEGASGSNNDALIETLLSLHSKYTGGAGFQNLREAVVENIWLKYGSSSS